MSDNPQFKRTDKAIIQALISLLMHKPFEKITVQDILEETPVTRATFYAHYRDKYEIAEKMLQTFLTTREAVRREFASTSHLPMEYLHSSSRIDPDYARALMKIHTENVDLRKALSAELEKEYLATSESPTRQVEARIYAQAYVELYFSMISGELTNHSIESNQQIFVSVAMGFLHLNGDSETRHFLEAKVKKMFR